MDEPTQPLPDHTRIADKLPLLEHEHEFRLSNLDKYSEGEKVRSEPATIGNFRYRILIFPMGTKVTKGPPTVAAFVEADPPAGIDERWCFSGVKYSLVLVNQIDYRESVFKHDVWNFSKREIDRGWHSFCSTRELLDPSKGWIDPSTGTCLFRTQVQCRNSETLYNLNVDYDSKKETSFIGLRNHGATCYLNCLLQTLFHIGKFRELVYNADNQNLSSNQGSNSPNNNPNVKGDGNVGDGKNAVAANSSSGNLTAGGSSSSLNQGQVQQSNQQQQPPKDQLIKALQNVFYHLQTSGVAGNCRDLMRSFGWENTEAFQQHDAQELNRILLDKVEERLKISGLDGEVRKLFSGTLESYIECIDVKYASRKKEEFYDIALSLKTDEGKWLSSVEDSIRDYIKTEILDGENAYDASDGGFKEKQRARKGIRFKSFPMVLNLLLKRFIFDFETLDTVKTNKEMKFPKRIDLSEFIDNTPDDDDKTKKDDEATANGNGTTNNDPNSNQNLPTSTSSSSTNKGTKGQQGFSSTNNPDHNDPQDAIYTLFGVTVQTGTVSSGHYYCFLRPWEPDDTKGGISQSWIKFDDETITKVSDYSALDDNFGGEDFSIFNYMAYDKNEIIEKRANWLKIPRVNNAYYLTYIRESVISQILKPPQPSAELVDRISKDNENKERLRHDQQTKVYITLLLERDLLRQQPCGFWDTFEDLPTSMHAFDLPKDKPSAEIWKSFKPQLPDAMLQNLESQNQINHQIQLNQNYLPNETNFAMFALRKRGNR